MVEKGKEFMEKHKKTMEYLENDASSDTLSEWIRRDKQLFDLLVEIQNATDSIEQQAEMAFHRVADLYEIPKYPDDIDDDKLIDGLIMETSVYEQLGLLKYLNPGLDGLKGNIICAIYFIKNGTKVDMQFVNNKYSAEGGNPEDIFGLGFKNDGAKVELVFVKHGESWFDLGCRYFTRE